MDRRVNASAVLEDWRKWHPGVPLLGRRADDALADALAQTLADLSEARRLLASEREQLAVNVDFVKQYQREVARLRSQLTDAFFLRKRAEDIRAIIQGGYDALLNQRKQSNDALYAAQRDLAEARKIAWLLLRFAQQVPSFLPREGGRLGGAASSLDMAFNALPGWLRRRIYR